MTPEQHSSLDEIERHLQTARRLGVLTITLLQREGVNLDESWPSYDGAQQSISSFLSKYLLASMRRSDTLLRPGVLGNTQALFLGPPRTDRPLDLVDIAHVRKRLNSCLNNHMVTQMTDPVVEHFGVFVGASMVRRIRQISNQRIIQRGVESAFANAISQRQVEHKQHAVHLKRILHGQRLRTVYQPIVDLTQHRTIGFEALTRVPESYFQTPDILFRAAHDNGALWKLERMSRHQALSTLPSIDADQMLFLNIEPDSFHDPELTSERFKQRLERAGLSAGQVVLELTEHVQIKDFAALRSRLTEYRKNGFRLAMDDVGAGHSGLQAIIELAPDFIKVDMSLVRDIDKHLIKQEMMSMIQSFADRTGCTLIAEGVERPEELASLTASGVRCAQGFLLAHPESRPRSLEWRRLMAMLG
jgi:EAL domain-containing protein (putative c-di-GMP-specific phosphodiesterase class I)